MDCLSLSGPAAECCLILPGAASAEFSHTSAVVPGSPRGWKENLGHDLRFFVHPRQ